MLFATLVLFFGGIELFLRLSGLVKMQDYTPPIYCRDPNPEISYRLCPNIQERAFRSTVTTNSRGFRTNGDNQWKLKTKNSKLKTHRVAVLGDSITFGYGVEDDETLPAQLGHLLPEYDVINAGVPGYHIGQEVALFKEEILPLAPDVLVLVFYWNDLQPKTSHLDDNGQLRPQGWQSQERKCQSLKEGILGLIPGKCWLDLHSAFYRAVKKYVDARSGKEQKEQRQRASRANVFDDSVTEEDLAQYAARLDRFTKLLPPAFPRLLVIWPDTEVHFLARPKLRRIAEERGFFVLDLYEIFGNSMETLSWDHVHPNVESLREAAQAVRDSLEYLGV